MDVDVAIRVRPRQPAVVQLQVAELQRLRPLVEGLVRPRDLRTRLVVAVLPCHREIRAQPQLRVLLGDDLRAGLAEAFVGTGVVPVPVRVEERAGLRTLRKLADRAQEVARTLGGAAIDHDHAFGAGHQHHVRAHAGYQSNPVGNRLDGDLFALRFRERARPEECRNGRAGQRRLQELSAVIRRVRHRSHV